MKTHFFGIKDEEFCRGDIPMTKQEIRIMALHKAKIGADDIIIDIGAGTGSFSIEAALAASNGKVYSIEREFAGIELIRANAAKFGAANITALHGEAPALLQGLPAADVIFVGGSGGKLKAILVEANKMLKSGGRLVVTAVTVETLHDTLTAAETLQDCIITDAVGLQATRLRRVGKVNMFQSLNQVFIIVCEKKETGV